MDNVVEIFTDGSCLQNPGVGGWAVMLKYQDTKKELSGYEAETTNNRMELMAAIVGLETLKQPSNVTLITDSLYVQKGMTEWISNWKLKNWRKVKNVDLWKRLDRAAQQHKIKWKWVKGHSGHPENERCDELARKAIIRLYETIATRTPNGSNVLGLAGYSGSGKTTLLKQLIPILKQMGISVSTVKRGGHFDIDKPGKDSYEQRQSGAKEVLMTGLERWALMHELRDDNEFKLSVLLEKLSPVDLIIVEGFKKQHHPKIEIYRADCGKPLLYGKAPNIIAVASDTDIDVDTEKLDLNNPEQIAEFIRYYIGK